MLQGKKVNGIGIDYCKSEERVSLLILVDSASCDRSEHELLQLMHIQSDSTRLMIELEIKNDSLITVGMTGGGD